MNGDSYKYIRFNSQQETRWATVEEIKRSAARIDLTADKYPAAGIPILSDTKEAYVDNKDTHTLIFGATGSKKTRLFCMPMINMMAKAGESYIVTDPKGELYAESSGLAKENGYKVVVINLRDIGKGDRWNPLSVPYEFWKKGDRDNAGLMLSDIAATIADSAVKNAKDPYWPEAAQELAIAIFYTLMEKAKEEQINMKSFASLATLSAVDPLKELSEMMAEDSVAAINFGSTVALKAQATVSGIVGTLFGMLRVFCVNERLSYMLSETSFDMRNFGREKTAVYIIVPDEKTTYHFLVTMFIKQAYEILISEAQKEKDRTLPIRVNFVLDEFCNIPKVPDMSSMISAARSRNMRYFLVAQSKHQLMGRYGEDADTIKGNCDNWVFLTSKELDLLREVSELCGNIVTADGQERRLVSTSELQRFSKERGEALIMHSRQYPIISELPDISAYPMFGIYPPAPMKDNSLGVTNCFSLSKLLSDIEEGNAMAPFASEDHISSQSIKIYKQELGKHGLPTDENFKMTPETVETIKLEDLTAELDQEIAEEFDDVEDSEKPELRKLFFEKKKAKWLEQISAHVKVVESTKARLSKLVSPDYAERFFAEGLCSFEERRSSSRFDWFD